MSGVGAAGPPLMNSTPTDVPAAPVTERVRTEREATTVDVVGCLAEGQNRRR